MKTAILLTAFFMTACSNSQASSNPPNYVPPYAPSNSERPHSAPAEVARPAHRSVPQDLAVAAEVLALTNQERERNGLAPFAIDERLMAAAAKYAVYMKRNHYCEHLALDGSTPMDRVDREGAHPHRVSENIAMGQQSASEVVNDWMNSAPHRRNILNPKLGHIGIGVIGDSWVQDFSE